jgi:citrate lyase subunit beta/citryl-CoA lyase
MSAGASWERAVDPDDSTIPRAPMLARSYLYVPGNRPDMAGRAASSGADAVVVDLEDAVPEEARDGSHAALRAFAEALSSQPVRVLFGVRISGTEPRHRADVDASVSAGVDFLRLPKVSRPVDVRRVAGWLRDAEGALPNPRGIRLQLVLETAGAILDARSMAADDRVEGFALGATDLAAGLRLPLDGDEALDVTRALLVLASAAAGLAPPVDSVYLDLEDLPGLRASTERARRLGFFGRSAIHLRQIECINDVFTPLAAEVAWAEGACAASEAAGGGATRFDGRLVDAAVVRRARWLKMLRDRFGSLEGPRSSRA